MSHSLFKYTSAGPTRPVEYRLEQSSEGLSGRVGLLMRFLHIYKKYFQRTLGIIIKYAKRSSQCDVGKTSKSKNKNYALIFLYMIYLYFLY